MNELQSVFNFFSCDVQIEKLLVAFLLNVCIVLKGKL
jgi:hypothetical protein